MKKLSMISVVMASVLFIGCGGSNISISDYSNIIKQSNTIPDVCKKEYETLKTIPRVAVVRFTNSKDSYDNIAKMVDPKIDKEIVSVLEGSLIQMGGVYVYSRDRLNELMKEQKLQQSGLFNEKTLVKVGQLTGIKYIITGSIDSEIQKFKDDAKSDTENKGKNDKQQSFGSMLLSKASKLTSSVTSGTKVTSRATIKIIDITTGQIVFSKQIEETKNIGMIKNPTYSQSISAIEDNLREGLKNVKSDLSKFFAPSGYILQIRSDKEHKNFIAQITLGSSKGIKAGQTFQVYQFEKVTDPVTNKTICDKYKINVKLVVSKNQIGVNSSWTKANGDDTLKLSAGQIVKRDVLGNSLF